MNRVNLKVAGFTFGLFSEQWFDPVIQAKPLPHFASHDPGCDFEVSLLLERGPAGRRPRHRSVTFEVLDCSCRKGSWQIEIRSDALPGEFRERPGQLLEWIIMMALVCSGQAVPLHACAVSDRGLGLVFAGPPNVGKTTMAGQWHGQPGVIMLGDERAWLRLEQDGQLLVYGSPLPSPYPCSTPEGVPLDKLFFLRHGRENVVTSRGGVQALTALLRSAYPVQYRDQGAPLPVDFCIDAVQRVPCYDLAFVPDSSVVEFVRSLR